MVVAINNSEAFPAEVDAASRACHFIATIKLLHPGFAPRAGLCTVLDKVVCELYLESWSVLKEPFDLFLCRGLDLRLHHFELLGDQLLCLFFSHLDSWALLEEVVLLFTGQAELKRALVASSEVLFFINRGNLSAFRLGTVANVFHARDPDVKGELVKFFDHIWTDPHFL